MRKFLTVTAAGIALSAMVSSPGGVSGSFAQTAQPLPPVLAWLQSQGVKLTAIGNDGGLPGYFAERSDGRAQTFYVTPDGDHVIAGLLIGTGGSNVTKAQLKLMQDRFADAKATSVPQGATPNPAAPTGPATVEPGSSPATGPAIHASTPMLSQSAKSEPAVVVQPSGNTSAPRQPDTLSTTPVPKLQIATPAPTPPSAAAPDLTAQLPEPTVQHPALRSPTPSQPDTAAAPTDYASRFATTETKSGFLARMNNVAWFRVGSPRSGAPEVYMLADPQCPFCHKAWRELSEMIAEGKISVDVILVDGIKGSEPLVISLFTQSDPGRAWFSGQGSADGVEITAPPEVGSRQWKFARGLLSANEQFAREKNITHTPWLAYVGKDGVVYQKTGAENLSDFLSKL